MCVCVCVCSIHRATLWILGEYCTNVEDITRVVTVVRTALGEVSGCGLHTWGAESAVYLHSSHWSILNCEKQLVVRLVRMVILVRLVRGVGGLW